MNDDLVKFLRDDVTGYIASWEGEFACDDADYARATADSAKADQAADTIAALTAGNAALSKACAEWAEVSQGNYQRAKAAEAALATARDNALEAAASKCDAAAAYRVKQINQLSGVLEDEEIYQKMRWRAGKIQAEILAGTIRAMKGGAA